MSVRLFNLHRTTAPRQQMVVLTWIKKTLLSVGLVILSISFTAMPALGAERISISYSLLDFSLSLSALETYAKTGKVEPELAFYTKFFQKQDLVTFREALLYREDINPYVISQFLYSSFGETALRNIGQIVETESRQNGFYALRAALILATADSEGLTLLNAIRYYPSNSIRLNLENILRMI